MTTEAEIEAAARAITTALGMKWDKLPETHEYDLSCKRMRNAARAALEAAAAVREGKPALTSERQAPREQRQI